MQYHCASDKETRLRDCVYLYRLTKHLTSIHTHTRAKAQPLTTRARLHSGDPLRECPITIAYHRHHPSSFRFIDCVGAGLVQGLSGVLLPTPHQLLDCRKRLLFPSRVLSIGCVLIPPLPGLIKRKGKKEKNREKLF